MKTLSFFALALLTASPVMAEETRHVDAHEHGVGQLDIAFDGTEIAIELHAPGADIVGFEYAAKSSEDRAAVDAAVAKLAAPLDLFVLPAAAECSVVQASAELESEEAHEEHSDHEHEDEHAKHEHEEEKQDDHEHEEEHAKHEHEEEKHDDHDHDEHEAEEGGAEHTEFHAEYALTCAKPSALSEINFAYFEAFPNALELEVQVLSDAGANAFEVERDNPTLDLRGMF